MTLRSRRHYDHVPFFKRALETIPWRSVRYKVYRFWQRWIIGYQYYDEARRQWRKL